MPAFILPFVTQDYTSVCYGDGRIASYITLPETGIGTDTGALLLLHGWGNNGQETYAPDAELYANRFNLVVTRVEYRHSGREARQGGVYDIPYDCSKLQTIDCLRALAATLAHFPQLSRERIYLWGGSQGAHLAAQCLLMAPHTFSLAILACGFYHPTSREDVTRNGYSLDTQLTSGLGFEEHALGEGNHFAPEERGLRSPVLRADAISEAVQIYLLHGLEDRIVDVRHSVRFYAVLRRAGLDATLVPIVGGDHALTGAAPDEDTRLKATLKYVPEAAWRRRRAGPTDFDFDHDILLPTSAGAYRVSYRQGVPSLFDPTPTENTSPSP